MTLTAKHQAPHLPLVENAGGTAPALIVCEHASNAIPATLHRLGLAPGDEMSHAAWDPGALGVARALAGALDAPLISATVSRLVHDCNRPAGTPEAMPARTETIRVPGNEGLSEPERALRGRLYYRPFFEALSRTLDARPGHCALVSVHSFTPVWHGVARQVQLGILHDTDIRLAQAVLRHAPAHTDLRLGRNEPYGPEDGVTHTLRVHGVDKGRANVMVEIRNDLIADEAAQAEMGAMLARVLKGALSDLWQGAVA